MAPERLRARAYGRSSDVWSFGLILLECIGNIPWKNVTSIVELVITVEETDVTDVLASLPTASRGLREILLLCLQQEPGKMIDSILFGCCNLLPPAHSLTHSRSTFVWYDADSQTNAGKDVDAIALVF